jgi:hypothetical protein
MKKHLLHSLVSLKEFNSFQPGICFLQWCDKLYNDFLVLWRIPPSGMWRRVALVITDVSEEGIACHISVDFILHSHRLENLKSYIELNGWVLKWRRNVSPVRYELGFYIQKDGILHSHRRGNLISGIVWKSEVRYSAVEKECKGYWLT